MSVCCRRRTCIPRFGFRDAFTWDFWISVFAEYLASLLFVFCVCGSTLRYEGTPSSLQVAVTAGLAATTLVHCFSSVCEPLVHINPVITVAMLVNCDTSVLAAILNPVAQCFGAITGAGLLYVVTPMHIRGNLGVTVPSTEVSFAQALGTEVLLTFMLILTVMATFDYNKLGMRRDYIAAVAVGLAITVCHVIAVPITGCSLNPARSLGPAAVTNSWAHHWIYWAGPFAGALVAAVLYRMVLYAPRVVNTPSSSGRSLADEYVDEEQENKV